LAQLYLSKRALRVCTMLAHRASQASRYKWSWLVFGNRFPRKTLRSNSVVSPLSRIYAD